MALFNLNYGKRSVAALLLFVSIATTPLLLSSLFLTTTPTNPLPPNAHVHPPFSRYLPYLVRCNGGFTEDVCHVCAGPGVTGCDQQCFSTKVYDSCGICGGVGPTGCDHQCYSTKTVGSCGICGVPGNCTAPSPACNKLGIRSKCPDLVCGYLNWGNSSLGTAPSAGGVASQGVVPAAAKVLEYSVYAMYGYYTVDVMYSKLHFYVDSLANAGTAIQAALSYDFTGNLKI